MRPVSSTQIKNVISLSLPMAGSRFLPMLSGFIATMMVAHLGKEVLASCALINAALTPLLLIFMSVIFSVSFIVSQSFGAKKFDDIGALVQQGMLLSFIFALILMGCFWYTDDLLILFHQNAHMLVYVRQYFHALMWGVIPLMLQCCLEQFLYGVLKQKLVIVINFLSMLLGIGTAYVLILGKLGLPALGVEGLGLTFAIQSWFDCSLLMMCCYFMKDLQVYGLFRKRVHSHFSNLWKILRIGWPISLQFGGELGAFFVITMMIGWLGTNALAAAQVTQQWMFLVVVPIFAMSEAAGILVGQSIGAKVFYQLNAINYSSLIIALGIVFLISMGFIFFPLFFASFYMNIHLSKNLPVLELIPPLFILMALTLLFNTIRDIVSGSLRGLFDTQFPMRIGLLVMWCLVLPLGYLFAFPMHMGVIGFRLGGNIGLLVGAVILIWRWRSQMVRMQRKP